MWATSKKTASFRNNLVFLGLVALAMVVLAAIVAYQHALRLIDLGKQVAHTYEVLAELEATESQIRDVETAQRGYVVIHEDFLGPYRESLQKIAARVHHLADLTIDSPSQKENVSQLLSELQKELAFAETVMAARSSGKINLALEITEASRGNEFTDKIRDRVHDMRVEERHLLTLRTGSLNDNSTQMIMTVALLGLISLGLLLLLIVSANMYLAERSRIEGMSTAQYDVARAIAESHDINTTIARVLSTICENLAWDAGACWKVNNEIGLLECTASWCADNARKEKLFSNAGIESGISGIQTEPNGNGAGLSSISITRSGESSNTSLDSASDMNISSNILNSGLEANSGERILALSRSSDLPGKVWTSGESLWLSDLRLAENSSRSAVATANGLNSGFVIPVFTDGKVSAVFELFSIRKREPDDRLLETLNTICSQLGQFISRRHSEDAFGASQARLHAILTNMAEAVIVVDMAGRLTEGNPAAEGIFGADRLSGSIHEWTESCGIYDSSKKTSYAVKDLPIFRAITGGGVDGTEMFIRNDVVPSGIWVSATGRPLRDDDGELIGGIMVLRDISERKLAEKRVSEFYSMVSHELRTPLTAIRASLGLMQGGVAGDLSEMSRQLVDIGREECDRLIRLINDILDIRKIEAGKLELKLVEVKPLALVQTAIEGMKMVAEQHEISLAADASAVGLITCDEDRILQVLTNLISNAIKFSPQGAPVIVNTEWIDSEWLRFSVTDRGAGIPSDQVQRLFQKFQQLDQSDTRSKGGTGLGLAISKAIIEEHLGRIGVQSTVGQGSTFYFELPRQQPESNGKLRRSADSIPDIKSPAKS